MRFVIHNHFFSPQLSFFSLPSFLKLVIFAPQKLCSHGEGIGLNWLSWLAYLSIVIFTFYPLTFFFFSILPGLCALSLRKKFCPYWFLINCNTVGQMKKCCEWFSISEIVNGRLPQSLRCWNEGKRERERQLDFALFNP